MERVSLKPTRPGAISTGIALCLLTALAAHTTGTGHASSPLAPPAPLYQFTGIESPYRHAIFAYAISSNDRVAGALETDVRSKSGPQIYRPFVWNAGVLTELPTLGGENGRALGVNSSGDVVGEAQRPDGSFHAFLWRDGQMRDLGPTLGDAADGEQESAARAVNDAGAVVGNCRSVDFPYLGRAFSWTEGADMVDLGPGMASGLNNAGDVVGTLLGDGRLDAVLWKSGQTVVLPGLGGPFNNGALDINDSGVITGYTHKSVSGGSRPVIWTPEEGGYALTRLGGLGANPNVGVGEGRAINNSGEVIGHDGQEPFFWRPGKGMRSLQRPLRTLFVDAVGGLNESGAIAGHAHRLARGRILAQDAFLLRPGITPAVFPDLSGSWDETQKGERLPRVRVTGSSARQKYTIAGRFILQNLGDASARAAKVRFHLSHTAEAEQFITSLSWTKSLGTVPKQKSVNRAVSLTVPPSRSLDPRGKYLVAVLDPDDAVTEHEESNNFIVFGPLE